MDLAIVGAGVVLVLMGAYMISSPLSIRNFVSPRTWKRDPETAEQYQRIWAYAVGGVVLAMGLGTVVFGLVTR